MNAHHGNVLLGVSGSIAAFKAAHLASELVQCGLEVRAVLTAGAARFVTPLTFEALTGHPAQMDVWEETPGSSRMGHLELARWADLVVVAPATAGTVARLALGLADDMLASVALASTAPLLLAPAMETSMWRHPATQQHISTLQSRGTTLVGPRRGRLASGAQGEGRMAEPDEIVDAVRQILRPAKSLSGRKVLVTAGPTYEPIDPVRFLGNRSSGKMGYAIAEAARQRGAEVILVTGPTALPAPPGVDLVSIESTTQLLDAVQRNAPGCDVVVMAAAVADFRPSSPSATKLKRAGGAHLDLQPTEDVAAAAARLVPEAFHVGFALESEDLVEGARAKLRRKGLDMVVANAISEDHNPFGSDHNRVVLVTENDVQELPSLSKREVAQRLWDEIGRRLGETA